MVQKGDLVRVVRGRKVPIGTRGTVRWSQTNEYGLQLGLVLVGEEDEEKGLTFVAARNVEVEGDAQDAAPSPKAPAQAKLPFQTPAPTAIVTQATLDRLQAEVEALRAELAEKTALVVDLGKQGTRLIQERNGYQQALDNAKKDLAASLTDAAQLRAALLGTQKDLGDALHAIDEQARPSARLDERTLAQVAAFAAKGAEQAVLVALREKLGGKAPEAAKVSHDAPRARLDLEPSPPSADRCQACSKPVPSGSIRCTACSAPQDVPVVAQAKAVLEQAKAVKAEIEARDAAPKQAAPASKLGRCPKCKAFMIGNHACKK